MTNPSSTRRAAVAALVVALVLAVIGMADTVTGRVDRPASAVTASVDRPASTLDGHAAGTRVAAHDHPGAVVVAASASVSAGEGRAATTLAAKEVVGSRVAPRSVALDSSTARALTSADQTVAQRLESQLSGCNLVMCQTAVDEFQGAVARLAGPSEKAAADALMRRVTVVPDNPSARVAGLRLTRSVQPGDVQIFGTADRMGIPIFTADAAFLRGAAGQGVWLDAYVHPSVSYRGL